MILAIQRDHQVSSSCGSLKLKTPGGWYFLFTHFLFGRKKLMMVKISPFNPWTNSYGLGQIKYQETTISSAFIK